MGSVTDLNRAIRYYEEHKEDYVRKLVEIKRFCGIPFIWIKQDKYCKYYYLFNLFPIMQSYDGGFIR